MMTTGKKKWKKAITDDNIGIWYQVLQNAGTQNDLGENLE